MQRCYSGTALSQHVQFIAGERAAGVESDFSFPLGTQG